MTPPGLLYLILMLLGGATSPSNSEMPLGAWSGRASECAYSVGSWDAGDRSEVTGRHGDSAEAFVESCRPFLDSLE